VVQILDPRPGQQVHSRIRRRLRQERHAGDQDAGQVAAGEFDRAGFEMVDITVEHAMAATRLDPDNPWVRWTLGSLRRTTSTTPALTAQPGRFAAQRGIRPRARSADHLGPPLLTRLRAARPQRAPAYRLVREAMQVMAGLFWDLGELTAWPPRSA
jgi:hypothetical protein